TVSDSNGNFTFKNLVFKDSVRFVVQARTAKDHKNVEVDIDAVKPEQAGENKNFPDFLVNYDAGLSPFLQSSKAQYDSEVKYGVIKGSIMLKEVVVKDKKVEPLKNSSNLNGPGNADQVIGVNDNILSGCANIADCLQGRINGVTFRNDTPFLMSSRRPMEIELDGLSVDGSVLSSLNPSDVASVEVLRNIQYTSIYGGRGSSGVLVITSKTGSPDLSYRHYAPGIISYMPKGYAKVKEFYSPKYDDQKINAPMPDLRSTIYWKPNIVTGRDGKASFEYFNADEKGTYRVVIEGIDANGNLGRLVYRYKVE
ncbi:MAG TPA: TonB-dependent receptor, partial [Mucilaginibacter sp.]|nr:TonB-dependent receptor [Mucilaginibacter sp.]